MAFRLISTVFDDGGYIPYELTAYGADISPELQWADPPAETKSFALVAKDLDADGSSIHWLLWNIPAASRAMGQGIGSARLLPDKSWQGLNDFKKIGYSGPNSVQPVLHRYAFTLYALRSELPASIDSKALATEIQNNVIAEATVTGQFRPLWEEAKLHELRADKEYLLELEGIVDGLKEAYAIDSQPLTSFFSKFSFTSPLVTSRARKFLKGIMDKRVRTALEAYIAFANRFRVQLRLRTDPLKFREVPWPSYGQKFQVRIVGGHLEPVGPGPEHSDEGYVEYFESKNLEILPEAQKLLTRGDATFVWIEDKQGYSLLKDLESFAYKDDGVMLFIHDAEQPYLGCIFGEKMTMQLLHDMGKTLTAFKKESYERTSGGRPRDISDLEELIKVDEEQIPSKFKAATIAEGGNEKQIKTEEVKLARHHSDKRRRKNRRTRKPRR